MKYKTIYGYVIIYSIKEAFPFIKEGSIHQIVCAHIFVHEFKSEGDLDFILAIKYDLAQF